MLVEKFGNPREVEGEADDQGSQELLVVVVPFACVYMIILGGFFVYLIFNKSFLDI